MLDLRPNCELCDTDLLPHAANAMICTYECTFCADCVSKLENVCPNCGGGFTLRPTRPAKAWRDGVSLAHQPASSKRVHSKYTLQALEGFIAVVKTTPPEER